MTAFQIPEVTRFTFTMPGSDEELGVPSLLDLDDDRIVALVAFQGFDASDSTALTKFTDMLVSLTDEGDDATANAFRRMSIGQKKAFLEAYTEAAGVSPGESPAS